MKKQNRFAIIAAGVLTTSIVAGTIWAADVSVRATPTRGATRIDPVSVTVVPVVADPTPVVATAAAAASTGRPPIIETRSAGRPAPVVEIPR